MSNIENCAPRQPDCFQLPNFLGPPQANCIKPWLHIRNRVKFSRNMHGQMCPKKFHPTTNGQGKKKVPNQISAFNNKDHQLVILKDYFTN